MFELDIIKTSDSQYVAAHDWKYWKRETNYKGSVPVSLSEFKKHKIRGNYEPMGMDEINLWFKEHRDAILITDKVNFPTSFSEKFIDNKRLIMELFSLTAVKEAIESGIQPLLSEKAIGQISGDKN